MTVLRAWDLENYRSYSFAKAYGVYGGKMGKAIAQVLST